MAYCPQNKSKHTVCEVPKFWGINFQSPDVSNAAPPALALDLASETTDGEVCKTALETTGTVAGKYFLVSWYRNPLTPSQAL